MTRYLDENSGKQIVIETNKKFATVNSSLSDNATQINKEVKALSASSNYNGCVVTFVVDDGTTGMEDRWVPLFNSRSDKPRISLGIIPSRVGILNYYTNEQYPSNDFLTKDRLLEMQKEYGWEMLSHTENHLWLDTLTDAQLDSEMKNSRDWLLNNGFTANGVVYPYGYDTVNPKYLNIKNSARKFYKYGINAFGNGVNTSPVDNFDIKRYWLAGSTWADVQDVLNTAITNKQWVVFIVHSYDIQEFDSGVIPNILDFCNTNSIPVLPFGEASELKGNILAVGEYTNQNKRLFIGQDGSVVQSLSGNYVVSGLYSGSIDDLLTTFPTDKITTFRVKDGTPDNVTSEGGVVTVYNIGGDGSYYNYETYQSIVTHTKKIRFWVDATNTWTVWYNNYRSQAIPYSGGIVGIAGFENAIKTSYEGEVKINIACAIGNTSNDITVTSSGLTIAIIPIGYRPSQHINGIATAFKNDGTLVFLYVIIKSTGEIIVTSPTTVSTLCQNIRGSISYFLG